MDWEKLRELRRVIAIEYREAMEDSEANPFGVENLDYEHKILWKGHASAYREVISYIDDLIRQHLEPPEIKPKLYCPMSPDHEVSACDYDMATRSCSTVCKPPEDRIEAVKVKLPENPLRDKIAEGSSSYEKGWDCGFDGCLRRVKESLKKLGIEVER